jgi:hypothetical protein
MPLARRSTLGPLVLTVAGLRVAHFAARNHVNRENITSGQGNFRSIGDPQPHVGPDWRAFFPAEASDLH